MSRRKKFTRGSPASAVKPVRRPGVSELPRSPTRLRVSRPGDLLGLVPYLLGFIPEESLVVILIRDGQVYLTARIDLVPVEATDDVVDQFSSLADHHGASELVLLAYSVDPEPARALLKGLIAGLGPRRLSDALLVQPDRWWSLTCTGRCCPEGGSPYDLSSHPMAAEAVFAGLTALSSRAAVEAQVTGPRLEDLESLTALAEGIAADVAERSFSERKELMASLVREQLDSPTPLSDDDSARFGVLALDVEVRDVAWAMMSRSDADRHVDLWGRVVSRTTRPYAAGPLCLLGMAAWISGNGALQNCCIDRAQEVHPGYSMTGLLSDINLRAVPPTLWDQMATEMRAEAGPLAS